jgi:hypothetical protein
MVFLVILQTFVSALVLASAPGVIPPAQLIATSDFVVVATMTHMRIEKNESFGHGFATLVIGEDVLGNLSGAKSLQLRWTNWPTGGPYADYSNVNGREALWFLVKRDGTVEAMNPFLFMATDDCKRLRDLQTGLKQSPDNKQTRDRFEKVAAWLMKHLQERCS